MAEAEWKECFDLFDKDHADIQTLFGQEKGRRGISVLFNYCFQF